MPYILLEWVSQFGPLTPSMASLVSLRRSPISLDNGAIDASPHPLKEHYNRMVHGSSVGNRSTIL